MIVVVVVGILAAGTVALVARSRGLGTRRPQPHVPPAVQAPVERAAPPARSRTADRGHHHARPARRRAA